MWLIRHGVSLIFLVSLAKTDDHSDLFQLEDFQSCLENDPDSLYCLVFLKLQLQDESNTTEYWQHIQEISKPSYRYNYEEPVYGICTNKNEDLEQSIARRVKEKYENLGVTYSVLKAKCQGRNDKYLPGFYDYFIAALAGAYGIFVLYISIFGSKSALLRSFNLKDNWKSLTKLSYDNEDQRRLQGFHGVRVTCLISEIIVHALAAARSLPVANPKFVEDDMEEKSKFLFFSTGSHGISTWFTMSVALLTYHTFQFFDKNQSFSARKYIKLAIITRYLRLVPLLMAVLAFHSSVWFSQLSTGIYWDLTIGEEYRKCNRGWLSILFFQNLERPCTNLCMPHAWSMETEMKFYLTMLFIVVLIRKRKYLVYPVAGILSLIYCYDKFTTIYNNRWRHSVYMTTKDLFDFNVGNNEHYYWSHMMLLPNLPGVIAGLLMGYIYYGYKDKNIFTKKIYIVIWKLISFAPVLGILIANLLNPENYLVEAIFGTADGFTTPITFLVGTIGIVQGMKGWMSFWDRPVWQIFGRLSYGTFLTHMMFIGLFFGSLKTPIVISPLQDVIGIVIIVVACFTVSAFLAVFVEIPMGKFAKRLIMKGEKLVKIS